MKKHRLQNMTRGWFIGNFDPSVLNTEKCEVAVKRYKKGEYEEEHYHLECVEVTVILNGNVEMNGTVFEDGDIVVVEPGESTDFKALSDVTTVVYKDGSAPGDKFLGRTKDGEATVG